LSNSGTKRLRVFAGPNGSGKTTIVKKFPKKIPLGVFVNADELEKSLKEDGYINLKRFGIRATTKEIREFINQASITQKKLDGKNIHFRFAIRNNKLTVAIKKISSYIAADIAEFIRRKLLAAGKSFSFETVLSHKSKLELLKHAKQQGYRIYLYYVATESPEININRVRIRIAKKGHAVDETRIKARYYRSLELLLNTIKISNRAYLFDNSGKYYELVAEVTDGRKVEMLATNKNIPEWFLKYVYQKIK
jgi:predicted ABC-type ATPase